MRPLVVSVSAFALACAVTAIAVAEPNSRVTVSSSVFQAGGKIPDRFTCKGVNVNPPIQVSGIPAGSKSLALIVDDPDAPAGLFTHWLVWNINPGSARIGEKSVPSGAMQGRNDFGKTGYGGPCPPSGTHRYFFRIFALDQTLDLKSGAPRAELEKAFSSHVLARGELMARYSH